MFLTLANILKKIEWAIFIIYDLRIFNINYIDYEEKN